VASLTTVAIPVLNAGPHLARLLDAIAAQRLSPDAELEMLVCDSGSTDGSADLARHHGATVLEIARDEFGHGRTRNLLMRRARGSHVAFVTQDALPVDDLWLERLLGGFALAPDVALTFGSYRPRPEASPMVARELTAWFDSLSPSHAPRVDRLSEHERGIAGRELLGSRGFFTDVNGCVSRHAWEQVPFPEVGYAEDHALAHAALRAGFAKVFVPDAAVIHSHDYSPWGWLQRSFDEARAMHEVYGWREPLHPRTVALNVWGRVGADWRWGAAQNSDQGWAAGLALLARSTLHHVARTAGTALGGRADRLPAGFTRRLSHERRSA
jgi:GT2 family glycosyltransferase